VDNKQAIMDHKETQFDNKKALILNSHPHKGEIAVCCGADYTNIGWGLKFKNIETREEFYVFNGKEVQWLTDKTEQP